MTGSGTFGPADLARARRDTPACERIVHFNNAGASLSPRCVVDAVVEHLRLEAEIGGYEAADRNRARIDRVYDAAARLLGARSDEIAVVESATRAWDMAFYAFRFSPGDRILVSMAEYASSVIAYLQTARRSGVSVEVVPNDEHGQLSVEALRSMIDERVKLVAITHVPTNGGLVNPAAEVGQVTREAGIPYLLDACQSVGQMPIDVDAIGCDVLTATGRKFLRGPRGTGLLYVRRAFAQHLEPPFLDLHAASLVSRDCYEIRPGARRFESWESYCAGKVGLGAAIDYALGFGLEAIRDRVSALADTLRRELVARVGAEIHDTGRERCGIVTFTLPTGSPSRSPGAELGPSRIKDELASRGINVSISTTASARLDMEARGLGDMVRASVHYYNTDDEIDRFCGVLKDLRDARDGDESGVVRAATSPIAELYQSV